MDKLDREVRLYTDGSCMHNPGGPGGWAFCVRFGNDKLGSKTIVRTGGKDSTTSNEMELTAILEGIIYLMHSNIFKNVTIITDSQYCIKCITIWVRTWSRNGWKKADKTPVANRDLIEKLTRFWHSNFVPVGSRVEWVKGHSGNPFNEHCDQMALQAAMSFLHERYATYENVAVGDRLSAHVEGKKYRMAYVVQAIFITGVVLIKSEHSKTIDTVKRSEFDSRKYIIL